MFTIQEARDILRIDGSDNDAIIEPLLQAIPPYLEATTGYTAAAGEFSPWRGRRDGFYCSYGITAKTRTRTSCNG